MLASSRDNVNINIKLSFENFFKKTITTYIRRKKSIWQPMDKKIYICYVMQGEVKNKI